MKVTTDDTIHTVRWKPSTIPTTLFWYIGGTLQSLCVTIGVKMWDSHSRKWFHNLLKRFKRIFFRCYCNSTPWYPRKDLHENVHSNIIDNSSKSPQILVSVSWYMDKQFP